MAKKPTTIDIGRRIYRAGPIAEIAGFKNTDNITMLRKREGLEIGSFRDGEYRYSILDAAELTAYVPLTSAFGFTSAEAIAACRDLLRPELKKLLNNRLHLGFWSKGALIVDEGDEIAGPTVLYLDGIGDRVITKLKLPLPDCCCTIPPTPVALRMTDAIFNYIFSPPGLLRWQRWRTAVMNEGGTTTFDEAAAKLGAPFWFLVVLHQVIRGDQGKAGVKRVDRVIKGIEKPPPLIVDAVRPKIKKVAHNFEGIMLQ